MGLQDNKRRQEEQLAATKAEGQQKQPSTQSKPTAQPMVDLPAMRQMIEDVVRAEFKTIGVEQSTQHNAQSLDLQALQHAVQSVVRAELQPLHTAVTIMANAMQAQIDALTYEGDGEDQDQDEPLPTASPRRTDDDIEDEQVYPSDENGDEEELDDVEDEEEGEGGYPYNPPRPESPTHKLRRPGPVGFNLGDALLHHPAEGIRRWEPSYEQ